jgi:hypothetical protein
MDYRKKFLVEPGRRLRLSKLDPGYKGKHLSHKDALPEMQKHLDKLRTLQHLLYAEKKRALLIVLQALDAASRLEGDSEGVQGRCGSRGSAQIACMAMECGSEALNLTRILVTFGSFCRRTPSSAPKGAGFE